MVTNIIKINKLDTIHPEKIDYYLGKRDYVANLIQSISKTNDKKKTTSNNTVEKKTENTIKKK